MMQLNSSDQTVGFSRFESECRAAALSVSRGEIKLEALFSSQDAAFEENVKRLDKTHLFSVPVSQESTLVRTLKIPLVKPKEVDAVLPFQAEPLLPYPLDKALIDRVVIGKSSENTLITLLATKDDFVRSELDFWQEKGIVPEAVTSSAVALSLFTFAVYPYQDPILTLYQNSESLLFALSEQGKLLAAYSVRLKENLSEMKSEIEKGILALLKQTKSVPSALCILCEDFSFQELIEESTREFQLPILPPFTRWEKTQRELIPYALAIGSALNGLTGIQGGINFRQGSLSYPTPWKKLKKPLLLYFGSTIAVAIAVLVFGQIWIKSDEVALKNRFLELLAATHKTEAQLQDAALALETASQEDLLGSFAVLQKEVSAAPDFFPLMPNIPRVSELLAWLATHPHVISPTGERLLNIESVSYSMVKRPEMGKKQEKYQVKVEIEFSAETPKLAREFHDSLISPNEIVDPKGEVKWSTSRGLFRATFFLKDKTVYPF